MTIAAAAVFCGSRLGILPAFTEAARETGAGLAERGIHLVYGGGAVGLMGVVAEAALEAGGSVTGIIPEFLHDREVMNERVTDLVVTGSMHERKRLMFAQADAFLILPGGLGTFDELMEIMTWRQLSLHDKPIVIVNVANWAVHVIAALEAAIEQGLADPSARALYQVVNDVPAAFDALRSMKKREEKEETHRL
ncbi:LOG family protein [Swaminathania salitolerans]|uniref:Cytokinin riboside 5'-monophosphate phosphoribohydrolase n=1 Tax=Swaminathania salitolerans TaxID=182838 RepID=A0A511BQR5_9PROT|nr:TIGR00730 family Rossman fold protein [Swaminathania salitolerans]GBQ11308.1 lysine decarboxylase [Swaminathania salitolerans LMG 21291]GEL02422.1 cytokinin riboside 5'-monophosphate phosphoribohydrolase [Swaminathania salitolerans]